MQMNDYKELIEKLRSRSKAIIREDAKLVGIQEESVWDADAELISDAADAIEQLSDFDFDYCHNCGAKMDGERREDNE